MRGVKDDRKGRTFQHGLTDNVVRSSRIEYLSLAHLNTMKRSANILSHSGLKTDTSTDMPHQCTEHSQDDIEPASSCALPLE